MDESVPFSPHQLFPRKAAPAAPNNATADASTTTCRTGGPFDLLGLSQELVHDPEKWKPAFGKDHAPT
jgi:hypothetical protein